ncbi:MAG TPA: ABC transporter permease [Thermodesulfobacteriota bacterium]|nr:ABC transporter permease [Thermodesulfobacteriota bacterium]
MQLKKHHPRNLDVIQPPEYYVSTSKGYNSHINSLPYYLDLITHLVKRDFILRFKGSSLGFLWSLLLPLAQLLVLVFLFQKVVPIGIDNYPAFVFSALLPWTWFSNCLSAAGSLFIGNRDLVRRPNFEPSILITVNILSNLLIYLLALPILFTILILYEKTITPSLLILPLLIVIQSILIIGLGLVVATLNVFYRDVQQIVSVSLMLLFYVTPVFYRSDMVGPSYSFLYTLNPVAVLIQSYRAIFLLWITSGMGTASVCRCFKRASVWFRLFYLYTSVE